MNWKHRIVVTMDLGVVDDKGVLSMAKCRYCDNEYVRYKGSCKACCHNCAVKKRIMSQFGKARDDLRERLWLDRLGDDE